MWMSKWNQYNHIHHLKSFVAVSHRRSRDEDLLQIQKYLVENDSHSWFIVFSDQRGFSRWKNKPTLRNLLSTTKDLHKVENKVASVYHKVSRWKQNTLNFCGWSWQIVLRCSSQPCPRWTGSEWQGWNPQGSCLDLESGSLIQDPALRTPGRNPRATSSSTHEAPSGIWPQTQNQNKES